MSKFILTHSVAILILLLAPGAFATRASAAAPGFCANYAKLAVHEFQANLNTPGCFKGGDNRWHGDFQRHYSWCLNASPYAALAERDYRRMRIDQCRMHAGY